MVRHDGCLPHLNLGIEPVNLGQLLFEDATPQGAKHDMGKVSLSTSCSDVAFKVTEERMPPLYAHGDHIQSAATIVLPFRPSVLAGLDFMGR